MIKKNFLHILNIKFAFCPRVFVNQIILSDWRGIGVVSVVLDIGAEGALVFLVEIHALSLEPALTRMFAGSLIFFKLLFSPEY